MGDHRVPDLVWVVGWVCGLFESAFFAGAFASSGFPAPASSDFAVRFLAGAFLAAGFLAPALPVAAAWEALSAVTSGDSLSLGREALTRVPFIDGWGRLSLLAARPFDYN